MTPYRQPEQSALDRLVDAARNREGEALVLLGEPGIGKTALLDYAAGHADGITVARIAGTEAEMDLPFAGVHQLVGPLLGGVDALPGPQRKAITVALGLARNGEPDRLFAGIAVLSLLETAAPLLCLVDDVQWLDSASTDTLAFAARRLTGSRVAMLFAVREPRPSSDALEGLPELRLVGLSEADAGRLLVSAVPGRLDVVVRGRIVAGTHGNPLALLEAARLLTPAQLAGGSALPEPLPLGLSLERSFAQRIRELPKAARSLLLLLSAAQAADAAIVGLAAIALGIDENVGAIAAGGLVELDPPYLFRHPFVRFAVHAAAQPSELRRVHGALADASVDRDSAAWHRALSVDAPNEAVAAELTESARRTQTRRGFAAAADLYVRAALLTPDDAQRAPRSLAAAVAQYAAGATETAASLLAEAAPGLTDPAQVAAAGRLRRGLDYELGRPIGTPEALLQAARTLEAVDTGLARDAHLDALVAAVLASRLGSESGVHGAALAALSAPPVARTDATARDLLLDGLAALFADGHEAAGPALRDAVELLRESENPYLLLLGAAAARELWDDAAIHALTTRAVAVARDSGALAALPPALNALAGGYEVVVGRLDAAEAGVAEAREIRGAIAPAVAERGQAIDALIAAWRGRDDSARALAQATIRDAAARGQGIEISSAQHALAILAIGRSQYPQALAAARDATEYPTLLVVTAALPELVEAAVRCEARDTAESAVARLERTALPAGTPWALGVLALSRALLAAGPDAEALYLEAIEHLKRCRAVPQLARAHLLYGEWQRRNRRRRDARTDLRAALEMLESMGAAAFAERARVELFATGERALPRTVESLERLTPQELRIAELAAGGASNPQIAAQLLISRRTVEYHLRKVFRKLAISSRTQLAAALEQRSGVADRTAIN